MSLPDRPAEAVIFDLDGVLVDSEPNYLASEQILLADFGIEFTEQMKVEYIGLSTREMLERVVAKHGLTTPVDELVDRKNAIYELLAGTHTPINEPMRILAELLRRNGFRLAVASGSSPGALRGVLEGTGLMPFFDVVMSADDVPQGKPAPDLFLATAAKLGIEPASCVVVEDSAYGVQAALAAGMRCVAIPYRTDLTGAEVFTQADLLVVGGMANVDPEAVYAFITA
ncbi:MAG: HAD family phosphatase [Hamadaea sp.]|nr:HAD family phosphatase [Hamadaea sp.]